MATFEPKSALPDNVTDRGKVERIKLSGAGDSTETTEWIDVATQAELDAHASDSTSVHGISDTSALLTTSSGIDALADVTITAAASGDILRHNGTAWVDAVGTTHFEPAGAVAAHEADATSVHGIADTSALLDTADIGVSVQAFSSVLAATTASFTTADETKLDGIEALADVTDETNVVAALSGATLTDLGTPASGDKILLLDASDSDNLKVAQFSEFGGGGSLVAGMMQHPRTGGGWWHGTPGLAGSPTTGAWPIVNRMYASAPFVWPDAVSISALGVNVAAAGAAGVVVRIAVFLLENGLPTTLLDQGTVAGDSTGYKTWTPGTAINVAAATPIIVFAGPQGSGSPGSTWFPGSYPISWTATPNNSSSWSGDFQTSMYLSASGAVSSSPTVSVENNSRMPVVFARLT